MQYHKSGVYFVDQIVGQRYNEVISVNVVDSKGHGHTQI